MCDFWRPTIRVIRIHSSMYRCVSNSLFTAKLARTYSLDEIPNQPEDISGIPRFIHFTEGFCFMLIDRAIHSVQIIFAFNFDVVFTFIAIKRNSRSMLNLSNEIDLISDKLQYHDEEAAQNAAVQRVKFNPVVQLEKMSDEDVNMLGA